MKVLLLLLTLVIARDPRVTLEERNARKLEVPEVRRLALKEATRRLSAQGIRWRVVQVRAKGPEGRVAGQHPLPGTKLPAGEDCVLEVYAAVEPPVTRPPRERRTAPGWLWFVLAQPLVIAPLAWLLAGRGGKSKRRRG